MFKSKNNVGIKCTNCDKKIKFRAPSSNVGVIVTCKYCGTINTYKMHVRPVK